jgi:broad-specificity NMP kinase
MLSRLVSGSASLSHGCCAEMVPCFFSTSQRPTSIARGIELVAEIVRELAKKHMVIVAVHTPELLRLASEVVVLDAGRVVRPT